MHARFVRLSSAAAAVAATTFVFGSPVAHAAEGDAEFLSTLAGLGIEFATPDEAVAAGNNICDIVSEGNANGIAPTEIRSVVVNSMVGESLTSAEATQVMLSAVSAYCPEFATVVGS